MRFILVAVAFAAAAPAQATNGLNLIGFGAESVAMGGADTAVARDTTALNSNPAGLARLARPTFDGYMAAAFSLDVGHSDSLGNDARVDNKIVPIGGFGASRPVFGGSLVAAIGLFAQGGSGAVYRKLQTAFGSRDELSALVGFVRITPGLAWRVDETFSLGVALPLNVMIAEQRVFPATSVVDPDDASRSFFGLDLEGARGMRLGLRLGAMFSVSDRWTLGVTFSPRTRLDAKGGEAKLNLSAAGLGVVGYRDARIEGFALAREITLGAAWQATPRTLLSLKVAHLAWADALRGVTLKLSGPSDPAAPPLVSQTSFVGWRDQIVLALGVAHRCSDTRTLYAGYNYARSPVRNDTLTPLLAAIADRHVTGGVAWSLGDGWTASGAVEYQPMRRVAYRNPNVPLGDSAEERSHYIATSVMFSRRW